MRSLLEDHKSRIRGVEVNCLSNAWKGKKKKKWEMCDVQKDVVRRANSYAMRRFGNEERAKSENLAKGVYESEVERIMMKCRSRMRWKNGVGKSD